MEHDALALAQRHHEDAGKRWGIDAFLTPTEHAIVGADTCPTCLEPCMEPHDVSVRPQHARVTFHCRNCQQDHHAHYALTSGPCA